MRLLPFVVPDELVHGAPLALWKALFDVAWPGCNARLRSHDDVLRALASPVSTALSRALGHVLSLGRDPGREALLDALVDRGLDLASFSRTDGATSLALRVVAGAVGAPDGPLAGVVERARAYVHYHDTDERSVLVFRAAERRPLPGDIDARVSRRYGVYDLGTRPLGPDARVRVLRDPRRDAGTIAADLTERFARDRVVALVPRGRSAGLGVPELAFDGLAPPGDLVPALASALHIDAAVDPFLVAPSTARLVLDARGQRVWLYGVLLARLSDLHVKLLLALARSGGEPVSGKDLDARIAPRRGGGVARDAKYLLGETVRKSFELVGKAPPADTDELIVRVGKKGYRLGVDAFVLSGSAPTKAR